MRRRVTPQNLANVRFAPRSITLTLETHFANLFRLGMATIRFEIAKQAEDRICQW
jgi:hypothetical protein